MFLNFFSLINSATNFFLIFEMKKFIACAEQRVGISTQDGRMGYLSLILYLREETSLSSCGDSSPLRMSALALASVAAVAWTKC